jgi:hypothetical protein
MCPMPPLPASVTISYGPRRAPGASGISVPLSVAVPGRTMWAELSPFHPAKG